MTPSSAKGIEMSEIDEMSETLEEQNAELVRLHADLDEARAVLVWYDDEDAIHGYLSRARAWLDAHPK